MNRQHWHVITAALGRELCDSLRFENAKPLSGGDISQAFHLTASERNFFVKVAPISDLDMFSAEVEGLATIKAAGAIRCPHPLLFGSVNEYAYLVLEYIPLSSHGNESELGEALARLHAHTAPLYGWHRNNTIGESPQDNREDNDWTRFWSQRRLEPQLRMASQNGAPSSLLNPGERLLLALPALLDGHKPPASLLHGDLWHGNCAFDPNGRPVIYDPAVYYGDREADLAMSSLFGGFGPGFWDAYAATWPLPSGYQQRRKLYMLYHVLNHFNLFGGGYGLQAQRMIEELLAQMI